MCMPATRAACGETSTRGVMQKVPVMQLNHAMLVQIKTLVAAVLEEERQLSEEDIVMLFSSRGADFELVCAAAGKAFYSTSKKSPECCR